MNTYKYNIALSFAEEDRNAALALALALELEGVDKVYYYPYCVAATAGRDIEPALQHIYENEAEYSVVFLSPSYFEKQYAQVEWASIQQRMKQSGIIVYMLPVLLAGTVPDSLSQKLYIKWAYNPREIAKTLKEMLGRPVAEVKKNAKQGEISMVTNTINAGHIENLTFHQNL